VGGAKEKNILSVRRKSFYLFFSATNINRGYLCKNKNENAIKKSIKEKGREDATLGEGGGGEGVRTSVYAKCIREIYPS
jgi:hypothetical protein